MTPTPPASRGATPETTGERVVREWWNHPIAATHDDLAARIDAALDDRDHEAIEQGEDGDRLEQENERLLAVIDTLRADLARVTRENEHFRDLVARTAGAWLAGPDDVPWEGGIDAAMSAAVREIRERRADRDTAHARLAAIRTVVEPVAGGHGDQGLHWFRHFAVRIVALLDGAGEDGK